MRPSVWNPQGGPRAQQRGDGAGRLAARPRDRGSRGVVHRRPRGVPTGAAAAAVCRIGEALDCCAAGRAALILNILFSDSAGCGIVLDAA